MIIAIDFDGTCVTHEFPNVGKDIGAIPVLRDLVKAGHQLILYTMRSDHQKYPMVLDDAKKWFEDNGIKLWAVQSNPDQGLWTSSPKCYANLYIDDAALGIPLLYAPFLSRRNYVDWVKVREMLVDREVLE